MSTVEVDTEELYRLLDRRRRSLGRSWRSVARETSMTPNTFSRLKNGHPPDAAKVFTLLEWLDIDWEAVARYTDEKEAA